MNALDELTKKYNEQGKTVYMYIKDLKSPPFENVSSTVSGVSLRVSIMPLHVHLDNFLTSEQLGFRSRNFLKLLHHICSHTCTRHHHSSDMRGYKTCIASSCVPPDRIVWSPC